MIYHSKKTKRICLWANIGAVVYNLIYFASSMGGAVEAGADVSGPYWTALFCAVFSAAVALWVWKWKVKPDEIESPEFTIIKGGRE
jgi:hypothetical protein